MTVSKVVPEGYGIMVRLDRWVSEAGIDPGLYELIKIRASQINRCAFCIDMHTRDAREMGETEQRIYALSAWREAPFFSEKERAALGLTESVTLLSESGVPDEVWDEAERHFGERDLANLLMAIVTINAWNRIAASPRMLPKGATSAPGEKDGDR
jgi:AhpD family alkylhydroperoxidase